jgi:ferritin-like metal-binding protein YciE
VIGKSDMATISNPSPLYEFFLYSIRKIYGAENHSVKTFPKMKSLASAKQLKLAIDQHYEITRGHVVRLVEVFGILGEKPVHIKCEAMGGLISDVDHAMENTANQTAVRDLAINFTCRKIDHHEMIVYRELSDLATTLDHMEVASLFNQTFREEQESATILSGMSEILTNKAISGNQFVI